MTSRSQRDISTVGRLIATTAPVIRARALYASLSAHLKICIENPREYEHAALERRKLSHTKSGC
jgi:hypothetical protein